MKSLNTLLLLSAILATSLLTSCSDRSSVSNWKYNDSRWGGFEKVPFKGQETGPNLVLIEGGRFTMGYTEEDVMRDWRAVPKAVTVSSFYIDETEISNLHYREFLYWMKRCFGADFPEIIRKITPDTLVWRDELAYNEPYVEYYLRHPSFNDYPVVGVNWVQANEFCKWRTDRVNEALLVDLKYIEMNPSPVNEDNFNTEAYLLGQYDGIPRKQKKDLNPDGTGFRRVRLEDGLLLPAFRLPTEAEWEYAALSLIGVHVEDQEMRTDRKIYPWSENVSMRNPGKPRKKGKKSKWEDLLAQGEMMANYKRARGDYGGIAGKLNDNAIYTAPIYSFWPNDWGLYNMVGNVNEWVQDVYRPMSTLDVEDLNPFRGNHWKKKELDEEGNPIDKDSLGRIQYMELEDEDVINRRNYRGGDARNYWDGDSISESEYEYSKTTLISDETRVYKGGAWNDEAYWLSPGNRRYLEQEQSTADIGFRCAMIRLGGEVSNYVKGGNHFKKTRKQKYINKRKRKKTKSSR